MKVRCLPGPRGLLREDSYLRRFRRPRISCDGGGSVIWTNQALTGHTSAIADTRYRLGPFRSPPCLDATESAVYQGPALSSTRAHYVLGSRRPGALLMQI